MDKIVNNIKKNNTLVKLIVLFNRYITIFIYVLFPLVLLNLLISKDKRILSMVLFPGISFLLLSLFRKKLNAKRPYEIYDYEPILSKDTVGESFPSRHVFSIFMISTGIFGIYPFLGSLLLFLGVILALCRFLGGVHFFRDVFVGALLGILPWFIVWGI